MHVAAPRATAFLERLIRAADDDERLRAVVAELPLAETARLLVEELVFRARRPGNTHPVPVGLDVVSGDERASFLCTVVDGRPIEVAPGSTADRVGLRVEYDVHQFARALYGRYSGHAHTARRTVPLYGKALDGSGVPRIELVEETPKAVDALLAGTEPGRADLGELMARCGSDKWGGLHWFARRYEEHFSRFRDEPVRLLEIGIGGYQDPDEGGASLKVWKHYFRRGTVYGMDLFDKNGLDELRITTVIGDQSDRALLSEVVERNGPFDIIIDDGSHKNDHILTTFAALFPHVRPGGFYVIEDLWTAYLPDYGGTAGPVAGPGTSIGLLKTLLDALHHEEWTGPGAAGSVAESLTGVYAHHNIAFLEKGVNREGGIPDWIPRTPTW
ncbi:Methyltransferase [Actinokineospora spheciospongiae]|uniref:Methyltransferase n=1 Tax=Actinokineospora spheciospongiae TaxID=909613 RepID=W7J2P5_9PSEU|nr:class I SAM-dependent methyltransferase [Actinokineospora spheciospongiae]EWC63337.1 Methyltransferase [Actinokineospora spheciospongiae]